MRRRRQCSTPAAAEPRRATSGCSPAMTGRGAAGRRPRWSTATPQARGSEHAIALLRGYSGVLQTDAYAAYGKLADPNRVGGPVTLAYCWAHWRRQWFDITKSPPAPIAAEVLQRIAELYRIETEIRGEEADARRAVRQQKAKPLIAALKSWLEETLRQVPSGSPIAQAIRYGFNQWDGVLRFFDAGRIAIDP